MHLFMQLRRGKSKRQKSKQSKASPSVTVIINNKKTRQVGRARQGKARQGQGRKIIIIDCIDKTLFFLFVFVLFTVKKLEV